MQLSAGGFIRGIRCDITGEEMFDHFTYYSLNGQQIYVNEAKMLINPGPKGMLDMDISPTAFNELWEKVKANVGNSKPNSVKCDLSNKHMRGEFKYWNIEVVKVDVDIKEVETSEKMEASVVSVEKWDIKACDEEIQPMLQKQKENCSKKFDENIAPKIPHKKQVIKIPAPITKPSEHKESVELVQPVEPETKPSEAKPPEIKFFSPSPIEVESDPDFYRKKAEDILRQSRKKSPLAQKITDTDIELTPEITKRKPNLPDVGSRTNVKRRNPQ